MNDIERYLNDVVTILERYLNETELYLNDIEILKINKKNGRVEEQNVEHEKHRKRFLEVHKMTDQLAKQGTCEKKNNDEIQWRNGWIRINGVTCSQSTRHLGYRVLQEEEKMRLDGKGVSKCAIRLRSRYVNMRKGVLAKRLVKICHGQISPRNLSRECKICGRKENKWHAFFCNSGKDKENE